MKYLIDTHIFLWLLFEPSKISKNKLEKLKNSSNQVYISSISFWEISIKFGLGKLVLSGCVPEELPKLALQMGLEIIDANAQELSSAYRLPNIHKDPFDRLIIHQCITRNISLVSEDGKFDGYREFGLDIL